MGFEDNHQIIEAIEVARDELKARLDKTLKSPGPKAFGEMIAQAAAISELDDLIKNTDWLTKIYPGGW